MISTLIKTKKIIFVLAMLVFASQTSTQTFNYSYFINANASQIKTYIKLNGGRLKVDRLDADFDGKPQRILLFVFSKEQFENGDAHTLWVFLSKKDSCFQFAFWHKGNKQLVNITKEFDDAKSGFKRMGDSLIWRNAQTEIRILPVKTS